MSPSAATRRLEHGELLDVDMEDLRRDFRDLRRARGLSQVDVAELLKVSQATISAFEQGRHNRVRSATLLGIHEIVGFWRRSSGDGADDVSLKRGLVKGTGALSGPERQCARCGAGLYGQAPGARYCPHCGAALSVSCSCGHATFDLRASYCSRCGGAIGQDGETFREGEVGHNLRQAVLEGLRFCIEESDLVDRVVKRIRFNLAAADDED